jgi:DNA-binding CsgD family transcriptional regulator
MAMSVRHPDEVRGSADGRSTIDTVRARLRALRSGDIEGWLRECEREIDAARRAGDGALVAEICVLAASGLDAAGRTREALDYIDTGLRATSGHEPAAHLWLTRSAVLAISGELTGARIAYHEAALLRPGPLSERERMEFSAYRTTLAAIALEEPAVDEAHAVVAEAQRAGFDWLASGMAVWLVPWLAAHGLASATRPWVDWLEAQAGLVRHRYRAEDAAAFRYALTLAEVAALSTPGAPRPMNAYAAWRVLVAQLRDAVACGDGEYARGILADLEARVNGMNPGFRDGAGAFRALLDAYAGASLGTVAEPRAMTSITLPAWLAGAEAAAVGGTRAEAWRWRTLLDARLPRWVVTSLEWPVSVARIRALLALRAGDAAGAVELFQDAVIESGQRHAPLERALALVQWDEAALHGVVAAGPVEHGVAEAARSLLDLSGVPALLHTYLAMRAARSDAADELVDVVLTRRERQVLAGLMENLTYREIAERMNVRWRTVQTYAHRIYRKLAVSGRRDAVEAARARGLL